MSGMGVVWPLMANNADVNEQDQTGTSLLMWAAEYGTLQGVKFLLANDADVDLQSRQGTALSRAQRRGRHRVAALLLANGAGVRSADAKGRTALMRAAQSGNVKNTQFLLRRVGAAVVNAQDKDGSTALRLAVQGSKLDVVQLLLANNADVHAQDRFGNTALHNATRIDIPYRRRPRRPGHRVPRARVQITKLLLANNADVEIRNQQGQTALTFAAESGSVAMVRVLLQAGAKIEGSKALQIAAGNDHWDVIRLLLANNADVDDVIPISTRGISRTALMRALEHAPYYGVSRQAGTVKLLLANNADVDIRNQYFHSALHFAVRSGNVHFVRMLLNKGADVNPRNERGLTPLHTATQGQQIKMTQLLLANNANVDEQDQDGQTALHYAANGSLEIVRLLLAHHASADVQDREGNTPLRCAASYSHTIETVKLLLANHANPDARDQNGNTLLQRAVKEGRVDLAKELLDAGADCTGVVFEDKFSSVLLHSAHRRQMACAERMPVLLKHLYADTARLVLQHVFPERMLCM